MSLYEQFQALELDKSLIGLIQREEEGSYFCTPVGARVIGWAGVDGIHYCFIDGFGEMVFAVSPMGGEGRYVFPLAKEFETFLRMIVTTRSLAAIEQIIVFDKERYEAFLVEENKELDQETKDVLDALQNALKLEPFEDTYEYVKEVQATFDYDQLVYTQEYYET